MRTVIAAVLISLVAAAGARAEEWSPPQLMTDEQRLEFFLPLARAAWPGSTCTGREIVHLHTDQRFTELAAVDGLVRVGQGDALTCQVWLASGLPLEAFCNDLVHEFGHLDGLGHDAPIPIMNRTGAWPACAWVTHPPAGSWTEAVWQWLPTSLRDHARIRCGVRHCLVRTVGFQTRRYRKLTDDGLQVSAPAYVAAPS